MARGSITTRRLKSGARRYDARIRVQGKQQCRTFHHKKAAENWLDQMSTTLRYGSYRELKQTTFNEYSQYWEDAYLLEATYKPSTIAAYRYVVDTFLRPQFGTHLLPTISSDRINELSARLLRSGLRPKTVRNVLNVLGKVLKDAVSDGYLSHSPMPAVRRPSTRANSRGRALKPDEINAVLDVLGGRDRLIVATAILTGMRRAEVFGLHWEDIDWDSSVIHVRRQLYWRFGRYQDRKEGADTFVFLTPKTTYAIRDIDLSPLLRSQLRALYLQSPKEGLVFTTQKGTPINPGNFVQRKFKPALALAGVTGRVRWHDLRHTYGALKLQQGANIYYLQRQMGHSSIQVTVDVYGHLLEARKPEEAAKTDRLLFGADAHGWD